MGEIIYKSENEFLKHNLVKNEWGHVEEVIHLEKFYVNHQIYWKCFGNLPLSDDGNAQKTLQSDAGYDIVRTRI